MTIVFTRGMSSPISTIVVQTSTLCRPPRKSSMTCSSRASGICPWATATRASGTASRMRRAARSIVSTRLCTTYTCPSRASSRRIESWISGRSSSRMNVWIGWRASGGVSITDRSRSPASDMCSVRGIGVAVSVRTSTWVRSCLRRSLWTTPKRCSSSMITRPSAGKVTDLLSSWCVPISTSTAPSRAAAMIAFCSFGVLNRLSISTRTGNAANRSRKTVSCCCANSVVGTSTATCLPSITALNAARSATSVLPYPTSPHTRRSIGRGASMSRFTSSIARSWSGVSSYGKASSISRCHGESGANACPPARSRSAYNCRSSRAISRVRSRTRRFSRSHSLPPSRWIWGVWLSAPTYRWTRLIWSVGT